MSQKITFIFIICFLCCFACGTKTATDGDAEIIRLNPHDAEEYVNLSEFADSVRCVKLQVDSGDVMGKVTQLYIKNKYIFTFDYSQKNVWVFDLNGKFVSKLDKKGQGPEEYSSMEMFFIEENGEHLEVVDWAKGKSEGMLRMLRYSVPSFRLVEISSFPQLTCNECYKKDRYYYCAPFQANNTVGGKKTNAGLFVFDSASLDSANRLSVLFDKTIETNNSTFIYNKGGFVRNDNNELFLSLMFDNTFYRMDSITATPVFTVDFGKYGLDNSTLRMQSTQQQYDHFCNLNGIAVFPFLNFNNAGLMSFTYFVENGGGFGAPEEVRNAKFRMFIKNKRNNKEYHVKLIKNDLSAFPEQIVIASTHNNCTHPVWHEDCLVDVIIPDKYFRSHKDRKKIFVEGIGEITADDDPIIVFMKLKKELL